MGSLLNFGCEAIVSTPALALVVASVVGSVAVFFGKKKKKK